MNAWFYLGLAIALEVAATFFLKLSSGFEKWWWGTISIALYSACFWVFAPALKVIPVGVAYAIWAGVGILAAAFLSLVIFGDRLGMVQILFIALILIGAIGLRLTTETPG